jgi:hypothetical protein
LVASNGGSEHELGPGDLIGRLRTSALAIDDPRISEAHALVSLRSHVLKLLALRGRFVVGGELLSEVELTRGLTFELAPTVAFRVVEVHLPNAVLALEGDGLVRQVLDGVLSVVTKPRPRLVPGYLDGAAAVVWPTGGEWRVRVGAGGSEALEPGTSFEVDGRTLRVLSVPLGSGGSADTLPSLPELQDMHLVLQLHTVELRREGRPSVVVSGVGARIICELFALGGPVSWQVLAQEVWGPNDDKFALRARLDVALVRLRKRLREERVRDDLVVTTGTGHVQLLLSAGDTVEDRL